MALQWPESHVAKLMYLSGLGKAFDYQSSVLMEYQQRTLELLREASIHSPVARLAPLVWKIFAMNNEFETHRQALPADADEAYRIWLDGLVSKVPAENA